MGTKRTVALLTACAAVFAFCFGGCGAGQKKKDTVPPYTYNGQTETAATETEPTEAVTEKQEDGIKVVLTGFDTPSRAAGRKGSTSAKNAWAW